MSEIDTTNEQLVALQGGRLVGVLMPSRVMLPDAALTHAAWLVAVADIADPGAAERFPEVLAAVQNT